MNSRRSFLAFLMGGLGTLVMRIRPNPHVRPLSDGNPELRKLEMLAGRNTDSCSEFVGPCDPEKEGVDLPGFSTAPAKRRWCAGITPRSPAPPTGIPRYARTTCSAPIT